MDVLIIPVASVAFLAGLTYGSAFLIVALGKLGEFFLKPLS